MFKRSIILASSIVILTAASVTAFAGKADVLSVTARKTGNTWQVSATIKHADEGWKHYANSFQVMTLDGKVLKTRVLFHPHVDEQPFSRSVGDVKIPENTAKIKVRAGDLVHGYGGKEVIVELPK